MADNDRQTSPDPRSGVGADGEWTPRFEGQRPPFEPGNDLAVGHGRPPAHGAYSTVRLAPRAEELAERLRTIVPMYRSADEPLIRLTAAVLARIEAAHLWLAEQEHGIFRDAAGADLQPVLKALSTWENSAGRFLGMLGCAPVTRARLGLDVARAEHVATLASLPETDAEADELDEAAA